MIKLLVIVDYQNDFVNGALGFPGAEKLEEPILTAIQNTLAQDGYLLFTRDTHPKDYLSTREGRHLPIPHCIEETEGHQLYGRLHAFETDPPYGAAFLDKPTFGSPHIGQAAQALCGGAPEEIILCGLVTDICVVANAILLHSYFLGATIRVPRNLVGSGNEKAAEAALLVLEGMGIDTSPLPPDVLPQA